MMDRHLSCIELTTKDAYAPWTESQNGDAFDQPVHRLRGLARLREQNRVSMLSQVPTVFSQTLIMRVCRTAPFEQLSNQGRDRCIQMGGDESVGSCLPFIHDDSSSFGRIAVVESQSDPRMAWARAGNASEHLTVLTDQLTPLRGAVRLLPRAVPWLQMPAHPAGCLVAVPMPASCVRQRH